MATATLRRVRKRAFGPEANGVLMTPEEFDRADFEEGWRYELINGVLIVSPIPALSERDPNEELGHWLRNYKSNHPRGAALDFTIHEHTLMTLQNRRRADRVIWAGLGRRPQPTELPTIIVEFVGARRRDRLRDYEVKRDEYLELGIKEYWVIDRFQRTMTVFTLWGGRTRKKVIRESQTYKTKVLPGFELPLAELLALADRWPSEEEELA